MTVNGVSVGLCCINLLMRDQHLFGISSSVWRTQWRRCCRCADEMGAFTGHLYIQRRGRRFVCAEYQKAAPDLLFFNGLALLKTDNELNIHQLYSCLGNDCNCMRAQWAIFLIWFTPNCSICAIRMVSMRTGVGSSLLQNRYAIMEV